MLIEILKPDFVFDDERGNITQLVHQGYKQINCVFSKKGAIRGNMHYHKENNEAFFVATGKIKLSVKSGEISEEYEFSTGDFFLVKKNIAHTFEYLEDTYLIGMYDNGIEKENGEKDIINA